MIDVEIPCDNCAAGGEVSLATVTLGDGLALCADCWTELKDDCEPIEPDEAQRA